MRLVVWVVVALRVGLGWDRASVFLTRLVDAWWNGTILPLAVLDGEIDAARTRGLWADFTVLELNIDQGVDVNTAFGREIRIDDPAQVDFKAVLATGGRTPIWKGPE